MIYFGVPASQCDPLNPTLETPCSSFHHNKFKFCPNFHNRTYLLLRGNFVVEMLSPSRILVLSATFCLPACAYELVKTIMTVRVYKNIK